MLVIGLTGSIGMGKSTVAEHFKAKGIPEFDADKAVHELYAGTAVPFIEAAFPGVTANGIVDRTKLTASLLADPSGFKILEKIVHPLVRELERDFLKSQAENHQKMAILQIPLLFETSSDRLMDVTIVASTTEQDQRLRVLDREGMTLEKLDEIMKRQLPDAQKREQADFVVDTSGTIDNAKAQVDKIIQSLSDRQGTAYLKHWK